MFSLFSPSCFSHVSYDNVNMIILKDRSFISALLSFLAKTVKFGFIARIHVFQGGFCDIQVGVQGTQKPTGAWTPNSSCVEKCCGPRARSFFKSTAWLKHMCWGLKLPLFSYGKDGHQPYIVGFYIPIKRIPGLLKVGWPSPIQGVFWKLYSFLFILVMQSDIAMVLISAYAGDRQPERRTHGFKIAAQYKEFWPQHILKTQHVSCSKQQVAPVICLIV